MSEEPAKYRVDPKPCPFCGSVLLDTNEWIIDDETVDAYECRRCKAGAPQDIWNHRGELSWQEEIAMQPRSEDETLEI